MGSSCLFKEENGKRIINYIYYALRRHNNWRRTGRRCSQHIVFPAEVKRAFDNQELWRADGQESGSCILRIIPDSRKYPGLDLIKKFEKHLKKFTAQQSGKGLKEN